VFLFRIMLTSAVVSTC